MKAIVAFVIWAVTKLFKIEVKNADKIPSDGACMVCLNHISLFDPIVILSCIRRPIRFISKQELMKIPVIGSALKYMNVIPIKRGSGDMGALKASFKTLNDGEVLGIFPTGTREKKNPNAPVKPGVVLIALKTGVPVIPVHIDASYRLFSKVTVNVGDAVDLSKYEGRKLTCDERTEAAEYIYSSIKALGDAK
jgi:1-acyl-sn-glycerol-3-phosphate acyltransferase